MASLSALLCLTICAIFLPEAVRANCDLGLNTPACLDAARRLLADEDRFWFGNGYLARCPPGPAQFSAQCSNQDKERRSIITRMRESSNDASTDTVTQILNVTYDAKKGSYEACGNTYEVEAKRLTLDPSKVSDISLWSADQFPTVRWQADPSKIYTLIVWDAGAVIMHAVYYNIRGDFLDTGKSPANMAIAYRGPKYPSSFEQPYNFLLFEQPQEIAQADITAEIASLQATGPYVAPQPLITKYNLQGPVGVSILTVKTDLYASQYMKENRIVNLCPLFVQQKVSKLPLSLDVSGVSLKTSVDVTFKTPETFYRSCCQNYRVAANTRMTNPLGDGLISPVYTRVKPQVTLVPDNFFDRNYYLRDRYTLVLLDVTDELAGKSNPDTVVHWMVSNIQEGKIKNGQQDLFYVPPVPLEGQDPRVLLFLFFKQTAYTINVDPAKFTAQECPPIKTGRCGFNLSSFVSDLGLTLEGASWFRSQSDSWSRAQAVQHALQSKGDACRNYGYSWGYSFTHF